VSAQVASQSDSLGLSSSALPLLRDLIHERLGVLYDPARHETLADRLAPLVIERGFDSYLDYYYLLKYDAAAAGEWLRVADALAVPETYFWREIDQVQAIVHHVIPELLRRHPYAPVRIWSVPCASGEEPLTIAMAAEEAGLFERGIVEIHGSDASPAAIERARAGRYRERSFRSLPAPLKEKYFSAADEGWTARAALCHRIRSWTVVNLLSDADMALSPRPAVTFCRNVFIYFSPSAIQRVLAQFEARTPEPAYLCVGASESLLRVATRFELEDIGGAFVYVKKGCV
jgi:chemotaxis protein methyltransferase CheR